MMAEDSARSSFDSASSPICIYCDTSDELQTFTAHIQTLLDKASPWIKPYVLLDGKGKNLGRIGGKLSLVQVGVEDTIYIIDVLSYWKNIEAVRLLQNPLLEKVMWEGRNLYSELLHEHNITLESILDLQLVHAREISKGRATRNILYIEVPDTAFSKLDPKTREDTGINLDRLTDGIILLDLG
jgi:hypothetical protein